MLYLVWTSSKKLLETALYFNTVKSLLSGKGRWPNGCFSSYFLKWWHRTIFEESRTHKCSRQCSYCPQQPLWDLNQRSSWKPLHHLWRVHTDRNREPTSSLTTHARTDTHTCTAGTVPATQSHTVLRRNPMHFLHEPPGYIQTGPFFLHLAK